MKILHIVAGDINSGAARGAFTLHNGLRALGVRSGVLNNGPTQLNDPTVENVRKTKLGRFKAGAINKLGKLPLLIYLNRSDGYFSTGFTGLNATKMECYSEADIVHLHWINGLVSTKLISTIEKPIVWTLRDMWPFTGGCHYSMGCEKYIEKCGACPELNSALKNDLSHVIWNEKRQYFNKNINVVGISNWITESAKKSSLFRGFNCRTISNAIDTDTFFVKEPKRVASGKKTILFGAIDATNNYKGLNLFLDTVSKLDVEKFRLVTFGRASIECFRDLQIDQFHHGYIGNDVELANVYSSADVFVSTSRYEAFGKTLAESLACGTPVACFDTSGAKDIVTKNHDGYVAKCFDTNDLAFGIDWICNLDKQSYRALGSNARNTAIDRFSISHISKSYKEMYREILEK